MSRTKAPGPIQKTWAQEWRKTPKSGWYAPANRIPPNLKPTRHARALANNRELYGRLIQSRTGHGYTGEFRQRFFPSEPFLCPCGDGSVETREHVLTSCTRYDAHRWILREVSRDVVLSEILGTPKGIEALTVFLDQSGAFTRPTTQISSTPANDPDIDNHPPDLDDNSTIGPDIDDEDHGY